MLYRVIIILFYLGCNVISFAQNRYVVHLKDKNNSPYSISNPSEYLSQRAIDRRSKYSIPITEEDFPVNPDYIQELKINGADVFYNSRWFNAVLIQADETLIPTIEALSIVDHVELVSQGPRLTHGRIEYQEGEEGTEAYENAVQNDLLGVYSMHEQDLRGEGMLLAFLDGGFLGVDNQEAFSHLFTNGQIVDQYNYLDNDDNVYQYDSHGTKVFSTVSAFQDGVYQGVATNAEFLLYVTEEVRNTSNSYSETRIEEYNMLFAVERADSAGADVISTSLGYSTFDDPFTSYTYQDMDGSTAIVTQAFETAFAKGIFMVTSAGNEGGGSWQFITAPADGPHVMSVGSVSSDGTRASSSSIGPNANGVIKPDVMAMGGSTSLISDSGLTTGSGTSYSAPQIAGLAALLWQKQPNLTNQELFDLILSLGNNYSNPNNEYGYGIPSAARLITGTFEDDAQIIAYPNPFNDIIKIENVTSTEEIELWNLLGEKVHLNTNLVENGSLILSTSNLPSGIYILKITDSQADQIIKLIKK